MIFLLIGGFLLLLYLMGFNPIGMFFISTLALLLLDWIVDE
jgi:hypothetical protein